MLQRARNTVQFVNNGTVPHPARRLAALSSPVAVSILPISYRIGERQLLFYRRLLCSDNIVLRTLARLVRFEMLGIAAKYDINNGTVPQTRPEDSRHFLHLRRVAVSILD